MCVFVFCLTPSVEIQTEIEIEMENFLMSFTLPMDICGRCRQALIYANFKGFPFQNSPLSDIDFKTIRDQDLYMPHFN